MEPTKLFGLTHQVQPTGGTCVQTCLAMALSVPVADVINVFGDKPMGDLSLHRALDACQLHWNQLNYGNIIFEGWHFVVVPSLNKLGAHHQILLHWSSHHGLAILDPAINQRYKQDGSDLISWSNLTPFWPGGKLPDKKSG